MDSVSSISKRVKMNRLILMFLLIIGCSFMKASDYTQTGRASFYANKFHGKRTSSGEIFQQDNLTAAHKTLKFGTMVKIVNLANDSVVTVKINDRLGKSSASIIDVSMKAAKQLNFVNKGHTKVKIEAI